MSNFTFKIHPLIQILSLTRILRHPNNLLSALSSILQKLNLKEYQQVLSKSTRSKKSEKVNFLNEFIKSANLFRSLKFQLLSEDQLDQIYTHLARGTKISEIDQKFKFSFSLFVDNLKTISIESVKYMQNIFQNMKKIDEEKSVTLFNVNLVLNIQSNRQNLPQNKAKKHFQFILDLNNPDVVTMIDFYIMFIFTSVISWIVNAESMGNLDGLNLIFEKLNFLLELFADVDNLNMTKTNSTSFFAINYLRAREVAINSTLFLIDYVEHNFREFTFSPELFEILNIFFQKANLIESQKSILKENVNYTHSLTNSSQEIIDFDNNFYMTAFHLLFDSLKIEIDKKSNQIQTLCNFISQVLDNFNDKSIFDNETFLYIWGVLSPTLQTLDDTIFSFFVRISHHYSKKNEKVCSKFAIFLNNYLKTRNPICLTKNDVNDTSKIYIKEIEKVKSISYRSTVQNFQFNFIDQPTFENGFNLSQPGQKPPSLREYFSNDILSKIDLISELYTGIEFSHQISILLNQISNDSELFLFDLAAFILISEDKSNVSTTLFTTIFNSPIFNGQFVDQNNKQQFINSIIYSSLSLLLHSYSLNNFLELLITSKMYIPRILGTIFDYLSILLKQMSMNNSNSLQSISDYFQSKKFISLFYNVSLFYQTANLNDLQNKTEIEICRQKLLSFMQPFIESWSNSRIFNSMFLSYLFEPPLQKFVFQHLKKLWMNENYGFSLIYSIFETCQLLLNENEENRSKVLYLVNYLLKLINKIFSESNSTKINFYPLHKPLLNIIAYLQKEDMDLICEILEYFSITADQMNIDINTFTTFYETIQQIEVTNDIRMNLIKLLAGSHSTSIISHFFIKQPFALPLLITLFLDKAHTEQLNANFKLIDNLINFSNKNAIMCHKGKLDLFLLNFIEIASNCKNSSLAYNKLKEKSEEEIKREINSAMSLFIKIALISSSISVVHKFISLLAKSFQYKSSFYLDNLMELITMKIKMPSNILPLTVRRTPTIELRGINSSYFQHGFTATFWVYLNQQSLKCHSVLFTMADTSNQIITCKIVDSTIDVRVFLKNKQFSLTNSFNFPLEQWFLFSINFVQKDKQYEVNATINSKSVSLNHIDYFEFKDFVRIVINNNLNYNDPVLDLDKLYNHPKIKRCCSYNNIEPKFSLLTFVDSSKNKYVNFVENSMNEQSKIENELGFEFEEVEGAFLGPFGFFSPLGLEKIIQMHNQGPRSIYINQNDIIVYIQFEKMNGLFTVVPNGVHYELNLKGPRYIQSISFDEVLIQYFKIHSLIPLFKFEEEKSDQIVDLFSNLLSLSEYAQNSFYQFHGFSMISHLLKSYQSQNLSYSLYSKFVALSEHLTVPQLKEDLFTQIILRFDLWCKSASIETQQRIIKHWVHTYLSHTSHFEDVLYILNSYNNNSALQNSLLNLLINENEISIDNTIKFISFVINQCTTYEYDILYLIKFIRDNAQHFSPSIHFINLINLVNYSTKQNIFVFIEMFNNLYKFQKIKSPKHLYSLFLTLVDLLNIDLFKDIEFVLKLIEEMNEIPECIEILFYGLAFSKPTQNFIDLIIDNLKPSAKFCFSKNWYLYLVFACIMNNYKPLTEFIMNFIVQSINLTNDKASWKSICSLILIIGESINYSHNFVNVHDIVKHFLIAILRIDKTDDELNDFLLMANFYIFLKPISYSNQYLKELYRDYKSNNKRISNDMEKPEKHELLENIKKNMKKERNYKFSLRFNKEGAWIDKDFATQLLEPQAKLQSFSKLTKALRLFVKHANNERITYKSQAPKDYNQLLESIPVILKPFLSQLNNLYLTNSKFVIKDNKVPQNDDLIVLAKCQQEIHERKMDAQNDSSYHCWNNQWQQLTSESAPWHNFKFNEDEKIHLKIDFIPCYAYCPMKTEKDSHYLIHRSFRENQILIARNMYRKELKKNSNLPSLTRENSQFLKNLKFTLNDPEINPELLKELPEFTIQVEMITIKRRDKGLCFFNKHKIELMLTKPTNTHHENHTSVNSNSIKIIDIYYTDIKLIFGRRILHHPTGIEIFTYIHGSYLLNFPTSTTIDVIDKLISISNRQLKVIITQTTSINEQPQVSSPLVNGFSILTKATATVASPLLSKIIDNKPETENLPFYQYLASLTNVWKFKIISNFEYLILLNMLSGRSFNDPSMYPVFPWIVADYESETIRWNDKDFFRDLSLPVGALNQSRLKDLIERRKEMIEINDQYIFLYGAGYSTPISLFNWMIRLEPFASLHVDMQNGHFDHPQRLFYSLKTAFKLATSNSNDYRELIPEFFFLPDFLVNKNAFNFGGLKEAVIPFDEIKQTVVEDLNLDQKNVNESNSSTQSNNEVDLTIQANESTNQESNNTPNPINDEITPETKSSDDNQITNETKLNESKSNKNDSQITTENNEQFSHEIDLNENDSKQSIESPKDKNIKLIESSCENSADDSNSLKQLSPSNSNEVLQDNSESYSYDSAEEEEIYEEAQKQEKQIENADQRINDVELPAWANNSIDFIYKHRKLLESKYVSKHLNKWIDLIFGVDQNNANNNQFHPWMYSNVWEKEMDKINKLKDQDLIDTQVKQIEEFLRQCGQIPLQLFSQKHPARHSFKKQTFLTTDRIIEISKSSKSKIKRSQAVDSDASFPGIRIEKEFKRGMHKVSSSVLINSKPTSQLMTIVYSEIIAKMDDSLIFLYVTSRGNIIRSTVTLNGIDLHYFGCDLIFDESKKFTVFKGCFVISNAEGSIRSFDLRLENSKLKLVKEVKSNIGQLNCLISDHNLLVSCGSDSTANIYDQNIDLVFSIQSFNGQIVSSYVNSTFSMVAIINRDSSVLLISTTTGTIFKLLSFHNREPLKVIISKSWGFIIIFTKEIFYEKSEEKCKFNLYFELFTVNGEKIGEKRISCIENLMTWETFTSPDSFDYLAFSDQKGNLFVVEIYPFIVGNSGLGKKNKNNDDVKPIFITETEIKTIYYWEDRRILTGICEDGSSFMLPLDYHIFK